MENESMYISIFENSCDILKKELEKETEPARIKMWKEMIEEYEVQILTEKGYSCAQCNNSNKEYPFFCNLKNKSLGCIRVCKERDLIKLKERR